jgi:hypothetical protein
MAPRLVLFQAEADYNQCLHEEARAGRQTGMTGAEAVGDGDDAEMVAMEAMSKASKSVPASSPTTRTWIARWLRPWLRLLVGRTRPCESRSRRNMVAIARGRTLLCRPPGGRCGCLRTSVSYRAWGC